MMKLYAILFCWCVVAVSCTRYAYYQSPMHGLTDTYTSIPMKGTASSAVYASGTVSRNDVNFYHSDKVTTFVGSVHRAHNLGRFQAWYGVNGALGSYRVAHVDIPYRSYYNENLNDSLINQGAGHHFFGAWGAFGGIDVVVPFKRWEWRVAGLDMSYNRELGNYYAFREGLPDKAANLIDRNKYLLTMGFSSDFVFSDMDGSTGYRMALVCRMGAVKYFDQQSRPDKFVTCYYTQTFHMQRGKATAYMQLVSGFHVIGINAGVGVQLGKRTFSHAK